MNINELKNLWIEEENKTFKGWDFSYLKGRWADEELPWDYEKILKSYLKPEYKLLDMGTGGGEFLLTLNHPYKNTSVTESYDPNVKLCKKVLSPLGISVNKVEDDSKLPFSDNSFDMIINRHESYDVKEVSRILKPNGLFITQQVGGRNNEYLSNKLIKGFVPEFPKHDLKHCVQEAKDSSFEVLYKEEFFPYLRFYDVGAIVYFANIIKWEFPGFSVETSFKELCELYKELKYKPYIESLEHRFIMVCKNRKYV